ELKFLMMSQGLSALKVVQVGKVLATAEYRSLENDAVKARYLKSLGFPISVISKGAGFNINNVKRWLGNPLTTNQMGRPQYLNSSENELLIEAVRYASSLHEPMTIMQVREKVIICR